MEVDSSQPGSGGSSDVLGQLIQQPDLWALIDTKINKYI
jgi:hypothetical protein